MPAPPTLLVPMTYDHASLSAVVVAEVVDTDSPATMTLRVAEARRSTWLRRLGSGVWSAAGWLLGVLTLILGLAVLASLPIVQLLSLGYLLEVSGRIARSGRLKAGFIGVRKAARVGGIAIGLAIVIAPLWLLSNFATSARLVEPGGRADRWLTVGLWLAVAAAVVHIASALGRGGRIRSFLWPAPVATPRFVLGLLTPRGYREARDAAWQRLVELRLPYFFWLGLRGAIVALVWLFVPLTLLIAGVRTRTAPVGFVGATLLVIVLLYLPFVQTRFAAENRLRAIFGLRGVRRAFRGAPLAFLVALVATLVLAVPLYLLKIQIIPRDAAWLACLFFVVFTWPAKVLLGWAYGRGLRREKPRRFFVRWPARLAMVPIAAAYVIVLYLTMYTSWYGMASLYAQHPFLMPVPFLQFELDAPPQPRERKQLSSPAEADQPQSAIIDAPAPVAP